MISQIITGMAITGIVISIGINKLIKKPKELYPEIEITEYYKLPWFEYSDDYD